MGKKSGKGKTDGLHEPFRVTDGGKFRLARMSTDDTGAIDCKEDAERALADGVERLAEMQEKLYAQDQWGVLLIFQAMDAAGKDGAIEHVMSGVNPQGCQVFSFKAPTSHELDHDFLWRTSRCLPERGRIGIFNRSYYEEVLVVRVHPEFLGGQKLPPKADHRRHLEGAARGHRRLRELPGPTGLRHRQVLPPRLEGGAEASGFSTAWTSPEKHWKFSSADVKERGFWERYMEAYEDAIRRTAAPHAPWYVVPADHKWFARLVVAGAINDTLDRLDLRYPTVRPAQKKELAAAREALLADS